MSQQKPQVLVLGEIVWAKDEMADRVGPLADVIVRLFPISLLLVSQSSNHIQFLWWLFLLVTLTVDLDVVCRVQDEGRVQERPADKVQERDRDLQVEPISIYRRTCTY